MRYAIIADGLPWVDSDGNDEWACQEALSLAENLRFIGYDTELVEVGP